MNLFMLNYQLLWRIDMADEMSKALQAMEANEPQANLYRAAEEYVSDQVYELMGISDDDDFNKLTELIKQAVIYGAHWNEQQMMKHAVDAQVAVPIYEGPDVHLTQLVVPGVQLQFGDKVKIIVIKEAEV